MSWESEWKCERFDNFESFLKSYPGADGIKTGYIRASGFQLAFSAVRDNRRLIGVYFGGDTAKHRDNTLKFLLEKNCSVNDQTMWDRPLPWRKTIVSLFGSIPCPASDAWIFLFSIWKIKSYLNLFSQFKFLYFTCWGFW